MSLCAMAQIQIKTRFEPSQWADDQIGTYIVWIEGSTQTPQMQIPPVPGLNLNFLGPLQFTQSINGNKKTYAEYRFVATAQGPGTYEIPAYKVQIAGQVYEAPPATVTVYPQSSNGLAHTTHLNSSEPQRLGLALQEPQQNYYVGQKFNLLTQLHLQEGMKVQLVEPAPTIREDALIIYTQKQAPQETLNTIQHQMYRTYTWNNAFTGIKPGTYPVRAHFNLMVPDERKASIFNHFFGSSLLDLGFEEFKLTSIQSPTHRLTILPLPDPQPENFCGGVGHFTAQAIVNSTTCQVGEPIIYTLTITGEGNFERLQAPIFPSLHHFKSYPPSLVSPMIDHLSLSGSKRFEYIFIPTEDGNLIIPEWQFSSFDPQTDSYQTHSLPAVAIHVVAGQHQPQNILSDVTSSSPAIADPSELIDLKHTTTVYDPWFIQAKNWIEYPLFWIIQGIIGLIFIAYCIGLRHKYKLKQDRYYATISQQKRIFNTYRKKLHTAYNKKAVNLYIDELLILLSALIFSEKTQQSHTWEEILSYLEKNRLLEDFQSFLIHCCAYKQMHQFGLQDKTFEWLLPSEWKLFQKQLAQTIKKGCFINFT